MVICYYWVVNSLYILDVSPLSNTTYMFPLILWFAFFFNGFFQRAEVLNFYEIQFVNFVYSNSFFFCPIQEMFVYCKIMKIFFHCSSETLVFTFSFYHCELKFTYDKTRLKGHFPHCGWFFEHYLLKKLSFLSWVTLALFPGTSWIYTCGPTSGLTVHFHLSV